MRALLSVPAFVVYAVVLLGLVVFFVGPLIPIGTPGVLVPLAARLWTIGALVFLGALAILIRWLLRRRRAAAAAAAIEDSAEAEARARLSAEEARLGEKFAEALRSLRRLRVAGRFGGRRTVYELPWYVFVGPPGAGKTTALMNCGLQDPFRRGQPMAMKGAGATRDCDWVFTDEAVFIDTAGRFLARETDGAVDAGAFDYFLKLLVRHRPQEPVNGLIVAVSVEDLATLTPDALDAQAAMVRRGLEEVYAAMGTRVPVYLVFTKADLLAGFVEFFQSLDPRERAQVWGHTFDHRPGEAAQAASERSLATFPEAFEGLVERLGALGFERLQEHGDLDARAKSFGFLRQIASLGPALERYLATAFAPDRFSEPIWVRGFYLTSATQEGQPIDRLIGSLTREFGLERRAARLGQPLSPRDYFLRGLLQDVVFPEAGLVAAARPRAGRLAGRAAGFVACIALPVLLGLGWWQVREFMRAETDAFATSLAEYEVAARALTDAGTLPAGRDPLTLVDDGNVHLALGPLTILDAARERASAAEAPWGGLLIDDTETLAAQAENAYYKGLDDLFRSRLMFRLERVIESRLDGDKAGALYDALKAYLMVAGYGVPDLAFLRGELATIWDEAYPRLSAPDLRASLEARLAETMAALEDGRLGPRERNNALVDDARTLARGASAAERALGVIVNDAAARELPPWTVSRLRGAEAADRVLMQASSRDLQDPVPALFTKAGFWYVFHPKVVDAVSRTLAETWVLQPEDPDRTPSLAERRATTSEVYELYYDAYVEHWRTVFEDLRIAPFGSAEQAAENLTLLSARASPLAVVLYDVARQTALSVPPSEDEAAEALGAGGGADLAALRRLSSAIGGPVARIGARAGALGNRAGRISGAAGDVAGDSEADAGAAAPSPPGVDRVDAAFEALHRFASEAAGEASLEALKTRLGELRDVARRLERTGSGDLSALAAGEAAEGLRSIADEAPEPVARMIDEMLRSFDVAVASGMRARLEERWRSTVLSFCRVHVEGRYPFGDGPDSPIGDVARLLGPGGLIETFFEEDLAPLVDTDRSPWAWRGLGLALGISNERLAFFEDAEALRKALFPAGGQRPSVDMSVSLLGRAEGVQSVEFDIGSTRVRFDPAAPSAFAMSWPGPAPGNGAEVVLMIQDGSRDPFTNQVLAPRAASIGEVGAWGLFKLVDRGRFGQPAFSERVRMKQSAGGRAVSLEMRFETSTNPFALRDEMRRFRCPDRLR